MMVFMPYIPVQEQLPSDFAPRWTRRLDELFDELLNENLAGYPVAGRALLNAMCACVTITKDFMAEKHSLRLDLRVAGCSSVMTRIAETEAPFPHVLARQRANFALVGYLSVDTAWPPPADGTGETKAQAWKDLRTAAREIAGLLA